MESQVYPESFVSRRGVRLFRRRWLPESAPRAVLAVIHGFAEHTGRYEDHARHFTRTGVAVEAFDLAGHGRSGGRRGYIANFESLIDDARDFVGSVTERYPGVPGFLFGHSLGGALAALIGAEFGSMDGLIMSSPALAIMEPEWLQKTALRLSPVLPWIGVKPLNRTYLCSDAKVVAAYRADPLTYRRPVAIRTAAEIIRLGEAALRAARHVTLPLLILHGTGDRITSPGASAEFYQLAASQDKSISLFKDMYHETFNEPEGRHVLECISGFLYEHCRNQANR